MSVSPTVGCYGSERAFNGLRLAGSLAKRGNAEAWVFLTIDADKVLVL
jgi:sulfur relay (sulfurtransferase) complex TusBCD TusD component (DsrE family)